ncbi:hypothetical protein D3C86_1082900 [compost metagenome]
MHVDHVTKCAVRFGSVGAIWNFGKYISRVLLFFCCRAKVDKIVFTGLFRIYASFGNVVTRLFEIVEENSGCPFWKRWIECAVFCFAQSAYFFCFDIYAVNVVKSAVMRVKCDLLINEYRP